MSMRDKTQADFDLEHMFDLLDTAMTSKDERIQNALRALLTIVALTKPQDDGRMAVETNHGPLRQMQEDLKHINRRLNTVENEINNMRRQPYIPPQPFTPGSPYTTPTPNTGTPWWGPNPNDPWTTSVTNGGSAVTGNIGYVSPQTKTKELK